MRSGAIVPAHRICRPAITRAFKCFRAGLARNVHTFGYPWRGPSRRGSPNNPNKYKRNERARALADERHNFTALAPQTTRLSRTRCSARAKLLSAEMQFHARGHRYMFIRVSSSFDRIFARPASGNDASLAAANCNYRE